MVTMIAKSLWASGRESSNEPKAGHGKGRGSYGSNFEEDSMNEVWLSVLQIYQSEAQGGCGEANFFGNAAIFVTE